MIKKLDQLVEDVKEELGLLLSISFGVFLFILFFQPFPIVGLEFNNILLFVGGIGTIVFLIMVLIRITIPRIFRNTSDQTNGIVFPPYFKGFAILVLSSVALVFYIRYVGMVSITFFITFKVVLICLTPPLILNYFDKINELKEQNEALIVERKIIQKQITNIIILLIAVSISLLIGIKAYLLIQLPIILIGHSMGIWLFYIQHQFDEVSWERQNKWDYKLSAISGSSFLKLPAILQWFTGNIGFHHVHHLSSRIPNYNLAKCHYENEIFKDVKPIKLFSTFKALMLGLWDETNRRMISFRNLSAV